MVMLELRIHIWILGSRQSDSGWYGFMGDNFMVESGSHSTVNWTHPTTILCWWHLPPSYLNFYLYVFEFIFVFGGNTSKDNIRICLCFQLYRSQHTPFPPKKNFVIFHCRNCTTICIPLSKRKHTSYFLYIWLKCLHSKCKNYLFW